MAFLLLLLGDKKAIFQLQTHGFKAAYAAVKFIGFYL